MIAGANYDQLVKIDYTNWKGERAIRFIYPKRVWWGSTEWHPEPQFLLQAVDAEKQQVRDFAMKSVHSWEPIENANSKGLLRSTTNR
jgi:hypothetical protein